MGAEVAHSLHREAGEVLHQDRDVFIIGYIIPRELVLGSGEDGLGLSLGQC